MHVGYILLFIYIYTFNLCTNKNIYKQFSVCGCNLLQCVCANSLNANAVPSSIYNLMDYPYCVSSPRLAVHLILCAREDAFATLWACVCSSWVAINQFTSKRCKPITRREHGPRLHQARKFNGEPVPFSYFIQYIYRSYGFVYMFFVYVFCLFVATLIYIYMSIYIDRDLTGILIYRHPSSLGVFSS